MITIEGYLTHILKMDTTSFSPTRFPFHFHRFLSLQKHMTTPSISNVTRVEHSPIPSSPKEKNVSRLRTTREKRRSHLKVHGPENRIQNKTKKHFINVIL